MYNISNEVKAQLLKHTRVEHVRGTIGGVAFDDTNVIAMSYSNRCSNTEDITFGLAYIGQLTATFTGVNISRKGWKNGKKIIVEWGIEYTDENEETQIEWIPCGVFYISCAEWTDTGINVTANDVISKLDKSFGQTQTNPNTIGGLAIFACQQCNVEFELTAAQARALPNGTKLLQLYKDNDIKTWRDYMAWLATTAGGYVTATRDGKVTIRSFAARSVVDTWNTTARIAGAVFSDFDVSYAGVTLDLPKFQNGQLDFIGEHAPTEPPFNIIKIGADPFLQDAFEAAQVIADIACDLTYTPFTTSLLSNLVYDLGDVVINQYGIAGDTPLTCCIMSIEWTFKELTTFKGYGADPALTAGKTKTDKAISTLQSQAAGDQIHFAKFVNSSAITITDEPIEICNMRFTVSAATEAEEWAEIKAYITPGAKLTLRYYYDGELIEEYTPQDDLGGASVDVYVTGSTVNIITAGSGTQPIKTNNYHYHINEVTASTYHTWSIMAMVEDGTATIAPGDEHVIIWAQGMAGEDEFIGFIPANDNIPFVKFNPLDLFGTLSDAAVISTEQPATGEQIITENGNNLTDETGDDLTTVNIDDLPDADPLDGSEYIPIVQNGATVKTTAQDVANLEE